MKKMKFKFTDDTCLLDANAYNRNDLTVKETRYLMDLIEVFKEKELFNTYMNKWTEIEKNENPVERILMVDQLFQNIENYKVERFGWEKDDDLRISIITKLKDLDIDFNKYFESLL